MLVSYLTDPGKVRTHNEDSVTIVSNASGEYLLVVADGMGGHRAGEVASSMVVTHLGAAEKVDVDVFKVETTKNPIDGIFLCSDGLTNMLTKEQIEKVLTTEELTIDQKVAKLIKKSNSRGGNDNISVAYAVIKEGVSSDS